MNKLLWKILFSKQGRWQLIVAGGGFCIGLFILLLSVQLYWDFDKVVAAQKEKEDQSTYLIINKTVTAYNTFTRKSPVFSQEEIDTLRKQDFFTSIGEFKKNEFALYGDFTEQMGFSQGVFFEAVPDTFVDNRPKNFRWKMAGETVAATDTIPIMLATEFLNLYNFGIALTVEGAPQFSAEMVKMYPLEVIIKGKGKEQRLSARVVGFSDRIPTILVPWDFLTWANAEYGEIKRDPVRVIAEVKDPGNPQLKEFLKRKKYLTNSEQTRMQKATSVLKMVATLMGAVGALFVVLSFVIFVLNFQLVLSRAKQEVDILLNIGYTRNSITRVLAFQLAGVLVLVLLLALAANHIATGEIHGFFGQYGFELTGRAMLTLAGMAVPLALLIGIGAAALMMLINSIALRLSLR